jgi:hypothetical protein
MPIILTAILLALITFYFIMIFNRKKQKIIPAKKEKKIESCPLCGSNMSGKRLYSKQIEYPDGRKMLEIRGCTDCRREGNAITRVCPCCKVRLRPGDPVYAAYEQKNNINKVIIKGCLNCYRR